MTRLQRQQEIDLREEQDREYREALEADQRREREREEERLRVEEEEQQRVDAIQHAEDVKVNRMQQARELLVMNGEEEPGKSEKGCARIRLMLPSGQRIERRFWGVDTVNVVRAFLMVYFEENGVGIENFQLNCNYPKKALADGDATVESEGLCPQAVIMVQDLDA